MEDKIKELIEHHKMAKLECFELLNELSQIAEQKINKTEKEALKLSIAKIEEEMLFRGLFVTDLESLL